MFLSGGCTILLKISNKYYDSIILIENKRFLKKQKSQFYKEGNLNLNLVRFYYFSESMNVIIAFQDFKYNMPCHNIL